MPILVISNEVLKQELLAQTPAGDSQFVFVQQLNDYADASPEACIDLLFDGTSERCHQLLATGASLIVVNAINTIEHEAGNTFIRINGWPGFLKREIVEASVRDEAKKITATGLFSFIGKKAEWVPDISGFIAARVVTAIINEAFFALEENISTEKEIDTAMKLGTNYPFGPFEWAERIGLKNVYNLLTHLSVEDERYLPCKLLEKKALA